MVAGRGGRYPVVSRAPRRSSTRRCIVTRHRSSTQHTASRNTERRGTANPAARVVSCFSFLFFVSRGPVTNRGGGRGGRKHRKALGGGSGASERGRLPGSRHDFRSFQRHIRPTTEMILPPCLRTGMAVVKAAAAAD
ncbi:unnamed protein product [Ixodes persulcatus]